MAEWRRGGTDAWEVPYLPIDPVDVGRSYEEVIRVNSQSGKSGIAWILEEEHGLRLPRRLQIDFGRVVQAITDGTGREITSAELLAAFEAEYLRPGAGWELLSHEVAEAANEPDTWRIRAEVRNGAARRRIEGRGNGPIDAFVAALGAEIGIEIRVSDYQEHSTSGGAAAAAIAYVEILTPDGSAVWGVGRHSSIVTGVARRGGRCARSRRAPRRRAACGVRSDFAIGPDSLGSLSRRMAFARGEVHWTPRRNARCTSTEDAR